ncbi:type 1 glutamine amidotransferase [Lentzea sp. NPDC051213]|uniref:type 1 glutamine amidotransferase n=1 Tax=Lentzea sp. NPDC051213 TaxID=3364126 RepID=UPI0037B34333
MTSPRLLVLQPSKSDPLAKLGEWLKTEGMELDLVPLWDEQAPASLDDYQGVLCLGGEMGALDDLDHPWLADVRKLLSSAVSQRKPVLAICLGAQLLAAATGGQVRRGPQGPEVGVLLVAKRDVAANDPLFADLPFTPDVLQFHLDEVHVLPPGAEHLAASTKYPNQAFRVGASAYGLQFHIETTPEIVLNWAEKDPESAACARPRHFDQDFLEEAHRDIEEVWQPFVARFAKLVRGELSPAGCLGTQLPLV